MPFRQSGRYSMCTPQPLTGSAPPSWKTVTLRESSFAVFCSPATKAIRWTNRMWTLKMPAYQSDKDLLGLMGLLLLGLYVDVRARYGSSIASVVKGASFQNLRQRVFEFAVWQRAHWRAGISIAEVDRDGNGWTTIVSYFIFREFRRSWAGLNIA